MCGVVGLVSSEMQPMDARPVARALESLAHRGPDAQRIDAGPGYVLGHARLAVLDLSTRGNQPMWDPARRFALVYNGEVFNYRSLRAELSCLGHSFVTSSDAEVVLHALIAWGRDALVRFDGQFALGFYDRERGRLLLARDRMGIKPLFFWQGPTFLMFASAPGAIRTHPDFAGALDLHAVSSFLSYRQVLGGRSFFEGIREIEPASVLEMAPEGVSQERYWSLAPITTARIDAPELRARIHAAVASQIAADVPVGLFLSGGLDSSILAAEASTLTSSMTTYTVGVGEPAIDESAAGERVSQWFGFDHVQVASRGEDHLGSATTLIERKGAPLGMHNEVEMFRLADAARSNGKVVLCGEGADELFAGYGRIFRLPFEVHGRRILMALTEHRRHSQGPEADFESFSERYTYWPREEKQALFDPAHWRALEGDERSRDVLHRTFFELDESSFFERIWWVFVTVHLRGLLAMIDGATMAAGVEARVPFLDGGVVDAARALRPRDLLRWRRPWGAVRAFGQPAAQYSERLDIPKYILRAAYRDVLPSEVLARRKQPFPVPLDRWYGPTGRAQVRRLLLGTGSRSGDLFRKSAIEAILERDDGNHPEELRERQLFRLISLELFLRINT